MTGRITVPISVPGTLWQHPEMLDALRRRDIGRVFQLVQQYTGASQTQIASACDTTQGKVSRYMRGEAQVEKLDKFEDVADGLDMPDEARMALGLAPQGRNIKLPQPRTPPTQSAQLLTNPHDAESISDIAVTSDVEGVMIPCRTVNGRITWVSVQRRTFLLGGMAAVTAAAGRQPASPRSTLRLPAAAVDGASPIEHLERMRLVLVESDNLLGPRHVIPTVHQHVSIIQQLRSAASGADRRALLHLQAQFGEFASWLHQDAGDFRMAQHWTDRALEWSQTAGDPEMTAYILARKSQLAGDMRDPGRALDYAEAALELASPRSRLKAAAAAYAAHGHALDGEYGRDATFRMHDDARATLSELDSDPGSPWAVWMNDAYLDVERARCLSMLGRHDEAAEIFQQAIRELPRGFRRDRGVYLAREALAHANAGQPDQAAGAGTAALSIAIETESGRIINELAHLDTELAPWHRVPEVAAFRDHLTTALPQEKDWTPST
jgi:tetratricopeptide (TPR) repeat protein/transcriptional regulator with XRE-family HTH domain